MKKVLLLFLTIMSLNCNTHKSGKLVDEYTLTDTTNNHLLNKRWYFRDYSKDSVLGINFQKAQNEILSKKKGREIIIALIDSDVNINHEDLKGRFWVNSDEIPNNNKDDDNNGYVDDIHGWNFLSKKNGERLIYTNYSAVSYLKKYQKAYNNNKITDSIILEKYRKALKSVENNLKKPQELYLESEEYDNDLNSAIKSLDSLFGGKHNKEKLDSIIDYYAESNEPLSYKARVLQAYYLFDLSDYTKNRRNDADAILKINNNLEYNPREELGDNLNDINDINYGHHNINTNTNLLTHGTEMAGVIAGNLRNDLGYEGMSNKIKLMVLSVFPRRGAEHDKDIALAIRYAVDNGAKVINMSSTKSYVTNYELVQNALKYAESKGVIFVTSAGNSNMDLDEIIAYPNRFIQNDTLSNFICVGNSYAFSNEPKTEDSNYGKKNVDLFAPGVQFNTTDSKGGYKLIDGTSVSSAIVSGTAGILYSYYPNLDHSQIRECILRGVNTYNVEVPINDSLTISFKDLSISGGILDVHKTLKFAEKLSKN